MESSPNLLIQDTKLFIIWPRPTYPVQSYLLASSSHTYTLTSHVNLHVLHALGVSPALLG